MEEKKHDYIHFFYTPRHNLYPELSVFTLSPIIRPILEYADVVWDNKTLFLINKLENVQIEAARIVTGRTRLVSINSLYKETGWETLQARRENHNFYLLLKWVRCSIILQ
jgi:hypothetical protein